jgi:hypothetical protein
MRFSVHTAKNATGIAPFVRALLNLALSLRSRLERTKELEGWHPL